MTETNYLHQISKGILLAGILRTLMPTLNASQQPQAGWHNQVITASTFLLCFGALYQCYQNRPHHPGLNLLGSLFFLGQNYLAFGNITRQHSNSLFMQGVGLTSAFALFALAALMRYGEANLRRQMAETGRIFHEFANTIHQIVPAPIQALYTATITPPAA